MTVVRRDELAVSPWKNGLGRKADVAAGDDWFVGFAWLEADVAFSDFPGMDRTCVLVEGAGFTLSFYGLPPARFDEPGRFHAFPGDLPARVQLADGPCTVFNVMTRRGAMKHRVTLTSTPSPSRGFALVLAGEVATDGGTARPGDVLVQPCTCRPSPDTVVVAVELFAGNPKA